VIVRQEEILPRQIAQAQEGHLIVQGILLQGLEIHLQGLETPLQGLGTPLQVLVTHPQVLVTLQVTLATPHQEATPVAVTQHLLLQAADF